MKLTIFNISLDLIKCLPWQEKMKLKEDLHQIAFVDWFTQTYNQLIFSIPNEHILKESGRSIYLAKKLNRMGRTRGIPDLFFPAGGLFIEMKKLNGKQTASQKAVQESLVLCGYNVLVAYGVEDAVNKVSEFMQAQNARNLPV